MTETVEKQLVDFLPSGKYSGPADPVELDRTGFAHVTNLGCEHHFGDLDSSQRRRPNASLHHHSSIQLLKRNRQGIQDWISKLSSEAKEQLFSDARKHGPQLRKKHRLSEVAVEAAVNNTLLQATKPKGRRTAKDKDKTTTPAVAAVDSTLEEDARSEAVSELAALMPKDTSLEPGQYVVVAYQDNWYPGRVESTDGQDSAKINFMTRCRQPGVFRWPAIRDVQVVLHKFVLGTVTPTVGRSGRLHTVPNAQDLDTLFALYHTVHFEEA